MSNKYKDGGEDNYNNNNSIGHVYISYVCLFFFLKKLIPFNNYISFLFDIL